MQILVKTNEKEDAAVRTAVQRIAFKRSRGPPRRPQAGEQTVPPGKASGLSAQSDQAAADQAAAD